MLRRLTLLFALAAAPLSAQTGSISGRIVEQSSKLPVENARVAISSGDVTVRSAVTDSDGRYRITGVPAGRYLLVVTRIGQQLRRTVPFDLADGQSLTMDLETSAAAERLEEVISTASRRTERTMDAPASTAVVPEAAIAARVGLTTTDHIRTVPGVDVSSGGLVQSNVVARGFNNVFSGTFLTFTDYRLASVPSLRINVPYLIPTPPEDIERIELVLGPGAALYGPNSANGVMHIITKSPFESEGTTLTIGGGERSVARGALRHAQRFGEKVAFRVSGDWMTGKDWEYVDPAEPVGTVRDFDVKRWAGDARIDIRPTPGLEWITTYGRATAMKALELTGTSGAAQVTDWVNQGVQTRVHGGKFFAQAFANFSNSGATKLLRTNTGIVDHSRQYVGQIQQGFTRGRFDVTVGGDAQITDPRTEGTINGRNEDDDRVQEFGEYVHAVARLTDKLDLSGAARFDQNNRLDGTVFSPRAALVYRPTMGHSLRFTFNSAFNTPANFSLFLDLPSGAIPFGALGTYRVVALGVPKDGFHFRRDCNGGLCMRSPFAAIPTTAADPTQFLEADATLRWRSAVEVAIAQNAALTFLRGIPAPTKATVQSNLAVLDPTTRTFRPVLAADVLDVERLEASHTNAYETGYKGLIGSRLQLSVDAWYEQRRNFIGPSLVETPNVFLDSATTAAYLSNFVPAANAQAIAGGLAKVPVGTVGPDHPLANTPGPDIIVTYRNYGKLNVWGSDFGGEFLIDNRFSVLGTYSWVNRNLFPRSEVGGLSDVTLNAPASKASATGRYRDHQRSRGAELRMRWVERFPVASGVYTGTVRSYALLDANLDFAVPRMPGVQFSITGTNLLDERHREFVGVPEIGRLVLSQLRFTF
jgi:outer membrane receptor for ferrienterochelin and colicins